jgi:hypothetical protein
MFNVTAIFYLILVALSDNLVSDNYFTILVNFQSR